MSALYWRGRLYESAGQQAGPGGDKLPHDRPGLSALFLCANGAADGWWRLGTTAPVAAPELDGIKAPAVPTLAESFPEDSPHLAKARLLANAGLNDYIPREIAADPDSGTWSALAEAQIYASYGEAYRAMRALKRALPTATTRFDQVNTSAVLADSFSRALLGHDQSGVGEKQSRSVPGGFADSAGIGVQPVGVSYANA